MELSIGIDIGGTKIAFGLVDEKGTIVTKKSVQTPKGGRQEVLLILKQEISSLLKESEIIGRSKVRGIGVGTAGQIDFKLGRVLSGTTNIRDWNNIALKDEIESQFNLPVWVDNDVNVVLLAEKKLGAAIGEDNVVCLALGTGVGGAVISGGELIRGSWGAAAELGHISLDMNGPKCNCGFRGCLEMYASGTGIAKLMKEKHEQTKSQNLKMDQTNETITSKDVFDLYMKEDSLAIEVIETMLNALTFGIVNCIHTFNPSVVILGGGVMQEGEWILQAVNKRMASTGLRSMVEPVRIVMAKLGPEAGLIGAAMQSFIYPNQQQNLLMEGNL
ncbi:ROK family protein [Neobacillus drentensis]|uniref:ROK family protein n=1 Tax=Neobacillus drentensis TaxID=220684 RepID=UPI002FFEF2AB